MFKNKFKNKFKKVIVLSLLINSFAIPTQAMEKSEKVLLSNEILDEETLSKKVDEALETLCSVQINNFKLKNINKGVCPQCCATKMKSFSNSNGLSCEGDGSWIYYRISVYNDGKLHGMNFCDPETELMLYPYGHHDDIIFNVSFLNNLASIDLDQIKNNTLKNKILVIHNLLDFGENFYFDEDLANNKDSVELGCVKRINKQQLDLKTFVENNFTALFAYFQLLVQKFYDDRCENLCVELGNNSTSIEIERFCPIVTPTNKYFPKQYTAKHELLARNTFIVYGLIEALFGKESEYYKLLECYELLYSQRFYELVLKYCGKRFSWNEVDWTGKYGYEEPKETGCKTIRRLITGICIEDILTEEEYNKALEKYNKMQKKLSLVDIGIQFPKHTAFERNIKFVVDQKLKEFYTKLKKEELETIL